MYSSKLDPQSEDFDVDACIEAMRIISEYIPVFRVAFENFTNSLGPILYQLNDSLIEVVNRYSESDKEVEALDS